MKRIICIGNGKNQTKLIKESIKLNYLVYVIDIKQKLKHKKIIYIKQSIYDFNKDYLIKYFNKIKIHSILFRSSGPSINLYYFLSKITNSGKFGYAFSQAIYRKKYLELFLKKNNLLNYCDIKMNNQFVIKPDCPIIGKKYVYRYEGKNYNEIKKIYSDKRVSHNRKLIIQPLLKGDDISVFYFKDSSGYIRPLLTIQEYNSFINNVLKNFGISSPPINDLSKELRENLFQFPKKIKSLIKNYIGFFALTFKVNKSKFVLYEINIGLLGDYVCEEIFPTFFKKNIYKLEIEKEKVNSISDFTKLKNKKFIGITKNKIYLKKNEFRKYLQK